MTVSAKVILHSISQENIPLVTLQLRYPRFIHSEFMTHRVFSRNASSSRAVPVERLIKAILDDTAIPMHWGKNKPGMSADEECNELVKYHRLWDDEYWLYTGTREEAWLAARDHAIEIARAFDKAGYHKQIVNRLLEPFSHINVVVTATEWSNFFALRSHPAAQPEIEVLSNAIKKAIDESSPILLQPGEWHLPYITEHDKFVGLETDIKCSVARCARVSYLTHEMKLPTVEEDLKLYDRLLGSQPIHASPAEHQATPDKRHNGECEWSNPEKHGNFKGWIQYRKTIKGECQ